MDPTAATVSRAVEARPRTEGERPAAVQNSGAEGKFPTALDEQVHVTRRHTAGERSSDARTSNEAEKRAPGTRARATAKREPAKSEKVQAKSADRAGAAADEAGDSETAVTLEGAGISLDTGSTSLHPDSNVADTGEPGKGDSPSISSNAAIDVEAAPNDGSAKAATKDSELVAAVAASATPLQAPVPQRPAKGAASREGDGQARVAHPPSGETSREASPALATAAAPTSLPAEAPATDASAKGRGAQNRPPLLHAHPEAAAIAPAGPGDPNPAQAPPAQALPLQPAVGDPRGTAQVTTTAVTDPKRSLPELPVRNENQIVQTARLLAHQNGGEARIVLHPPQLGELGIRLIVTHDLARLALTADHRGVAQLLTHHLPELRAALDAHGIRLDRVDVDLRGDADGTFGRASRRETPDPEDSGDRGRRGRLRAGSAGGGGVLPPLRGMTPRWAHLGTVDLRI